MSTQLAAPFVTQSIRGLSLLQPWASLMAFGEKRVETRSWFTSYRGLVAIAASAQWRTRDLQLAVADSDFVGAWARNGVRQMKELPLGAIVAVGTLTNCVRTDEFDFSVGSCGLHEGSFGNYTAGRWAWMFSDMRTLEMPIPVKGALGLYSLPTDVENEVRRAAAR